MRTLSLVFVAFFSLVVTATGCASEVQVVANGDDGGGESCALGTSRACTGDHGEAGERDCALVDGEPRWMECVAVPSSGSTPLVLAFENEEVAFVASESGAFDLTGLGQSIASDWPSAATPWLALDRNGDGAIGGGEELFGSAVKLASGRRAENGFEALAELDANGDGRITAADPAFEKLVVWTDRDGDRVSSAAELEAASAHGLVSVELAFERRRVCDGRGNCGIERASFRFVREGREQRGNVIDVHLAHR